MAYASRSGRARVSSSNPQAFAVCNRCGFWYNRVDLQNQYAWRGAALLPTWKFVCGRCLDVPNEQKRAIVLPADPVPVVLPFPEFFEDDEVDVMGLYLPAGALPVVMSEVAGGVVMVTTDLRLMMLVPPPPPPLPTDFRTGLPLPLTTAMEAVSGVLMGPTPVGRPNGYYALDSQPPQAVVIFMAQVNGTYMAQTNGTAMAKAARGQPSTGMTPALPDDDGSATPPGVRIPITSLLADGTPLVRATTSGPHGLSLNSQIAVQGSGNPLADGTFSVIPITATVFTYGTYSPIPAGSLLEPLTVVVATQAGLPRSYPALPQTGQPQRPKTRTSQ